MLSIILHVKSYMYWQYISKNILKEEEHNCYNYYMAHIVADKVAPFFSKFQSLP